MAIEDALYTRLTTHAGLSALIGTRAYPTLLPEKPTLPAVRYRRISGPRESAMGVDLGIAHARFQLDSFAATYTGARDVAAQVRAALQRYRATVGGVEILDIFVENELHLYEDELKIHQVLQDYRVHHRE